MLEQSGVFILLAIVGLIMELTVDVMKNMIRNADSLSELQRFVGPSDDEDEQARGRLTAMDAIWNRNGESFDNMPQHDLDRYNRLQEEQNAYENKYC